MTNSQMKIAARARAPISHAAHTFLHACDLNCFDCGIGVTKSQK
jgi:hypothetical protein